MDKEVEKEYTTFIRKQLEEMAKNINKKFQKNQIKRENNVFLIFKNDEVKKSMGLGRSVDSQLGTRLQKIAMFVARRKYGFENVPNVITIYAQDNKIKLTMMSIPNCFTQKVYWTDKQPNELLSKTYKRLYIKNNKEFTCKCISFDNKNETNNIIENEFNNRDSKGNGIPIDLFIFKENEKKEKIAYSFEIKAGGNLDTKNAPSNANEVNSLKNIFSFCDESISVFATCYDGKGDGQPDGSIEKYLDRKCILIGRKFWEEILESGVSYDKFIEIYKTAYALAKVEDTILE